MTGLSDKDRARDEWAAVERATQRRRAQAARSEGQGEPETAADAAVERIWEAHGPEVKSALAGQGEPVAFLANALVMTGLKTEAELIDMANVGQSLLERIALLTQDGPFKGWTPRDDPAEIVFDLVNHYEDAAGTSPPDPQARIEALEAERDHWKRIAHDRLVSANEQLARAREAEAALTRSKADADLCAEGWAKEIEHGNALRGMVAPMHAALKKAEQFIVNGVELGFIRMPDPGTPDPAHDTLPAIQAALSTLTQEKTNVG
ncbi:hypothetical protein [Phenylobacterium sp.]|uniref:hypothetical protein n=1 Tax=Phenylobacterium sp. TaxID=1871053 RepID=UPI002601D61F|nr:hypothetical protein [Phenylobacterium sp.]